ncbi:GNAT family N-acetyltransferase (plasmid) [Aliiroseovarius sp. M344]|uniref:GNAT family N-acetyltransferase n=1 Tax=Aliiroseovarius sp. M344 TaxID=2867010 RepID=UPI0021ADC26E|nr:GNAT family N-acetyltransferase [Aliiroseovarius sp. M344]UWQ16059.1 GNAT family N-acetyltransferase [Aliiroseovarius sp. M344]
MSGTATDLSITWVDLHQTSASSLDDWHHLATTTGSDMWFTPAWVERWVRHFAKNRHAIAGCAFWGDGLVGVLPFVIDTIYPFGLPVKVAQLAGPHPLFGVMRLPILAEHERAMLDQIVDQFFEHHRCDCVSLAPISNAFNLADRVRATLDSNAIASLNPDSKARNHTIIRLPSSFEDYLKTLSRNRRNKYRKTKRVLEDDHNVSTRIFNGRSTRKMLGKFTSAHEAQWQAKGKLGHFADWRGSHDFYADLSESGTDRAGVRLYVQQTPDQEIVTGLFCFAAGKSCHALVPSRNNDWSELRLDIGLHAQFERIENLINDGIDIIDSGAGEYDYKASLKGETVEMHRFLVSRPTMIGRFKMNALRRYGEALNFLYYRIWYNKAAPWLRRKGLHVGGLWNSWIRTRV